MPYLGYWQLINAVDRYVIYDDVNFIKGGWINRNRILVQGRPQYVNVRMEGASSFKKINEIHVNKDSRWRDNLMKTIEMAYSKAPYFPVVRSLLSAIFFYETDNLAKYLIYSIQKICDYLQIKTEIFISSALEKSDGLSGQDRVLDICRRLSATKYYNAIGGQGLYSKKSFLEHGIELSFLSTDNIRYTQFGLPFVPALSILDMMMFNSLDTMRQFLSCYSLI